MMETSLRYGNRDRSASAPSPPAAAAHPRAGLKLHVKETFALPEDTSLAVVAEIDIASAAVSGRAALTRSLYPPKRSALAAVLRRVDFGATAATAPAGPELSYGAAAKLHVDLSDDGLLSLQASGDVTVAGKAVASCVGALSGAPPPSKSGQRLGGAKGGSKGSLTSARREFAAGVSANGRVELVQVLLGVDGGTQDLKLCLGYDAGAGQPYARIKENHWTLQADFKGGWNVQCNL